MPYSREEAQKRYKREWGSQPHVKARRKEYYRKNREKILAYWRKFNKKHSKRLCAAAKERYRRNRDRQRALRLEWKKNNPEIYRERRRLWNRRYRVKHPDRDKKSKSSYMRDCRSRYLFLRRIRYIRKTWGPLWADRLIHLELVCEVTDGQEYGGTA